MKHIMKLAVVGLMLLGLVVMASGCGGAGETTDITGLKDLVGKKVGVQANTTGQYAAEKVEGMKNEDIKKYPTTPDALMALSTGEVDAVVADSPVVLNYIKHNPEIGLKTVEDDFEKEYYGMAVKEGNKELLDGINDALAAIKENGTYDKVYNKYFGEASGGTDFKVEPVESDKTLVVGTEAAYAPFEWQENGEITGFDADLIQAIAAEMGVKLVHQNVAWDALYPSLNTGAIDAVISAMTITEEREQEVDFSEPYFEAMQIIAIRGK